jgi:hypothetical protein
MTERRNNRSTRPGAPASSARVVASRDKSQVVGPLAQLTQVVDVSSVADPHLSAVAIPARGYPAFALVGELDLEPRQFDEPVQDWVRDMSDLLRSARQTVITGRSRVPPPPEFSRDL